MFRPRFNLSNNLFLTGILTITSVFLIVIYNISSNSDSFNSSFMDIIFALTFLVVVFLSFLWMKKKSSFESDDMLRVNGSLPLIKTILSSLCFVTFFMISLLFLFDLSLYRDFFQFGKEIFILLITLSNILLLYHLHLAFERPKRPNAYIFKFFTKKITKITNNYETTFTIKVMTIIGIFVLPFSLISFLTQNLLLSYIAASIINNTILGGYWIGYGLYKYFLFIWGFQQEKKGSLIDIIMNFFSFNGLSVFFAFFFIIQSILLALLIIVHFLFPEILLQSNTISIAIFVFIISLYAVILNIIGDRTQKQPWYSSVFSIYVFTIPLNFVFILQYMLQSSETSLFFNIFEFSHVLTYLLLFTYVSSLFIIFSVNNKYLSINLWKDPYETNQLLAKLKISLENPSNTQLILLQKLGTTLKDRDIVLQVITTYKAILSSNKNTPKAQLLYSLQNFVLNQFDEKNDDEIFNLLIELVHDLLDIRPDYSEIFYKKALNLLQTGYSHIKKESLNLLGHIIQINPKIQYIDEIYNEIEEFYAYGDEKFKRFSLDALKYIITNFTFDLKRVKKFLTEIIEFESFGISTVIYDLFEEIYSKDKEPSIFSLTKKTLQSLDSTAKLGAIKFLRKHMPSDVTEQKEFLNLLMNNLKDIDNAIGVRTNIIYTLGELIKKKEANKDLLIQLQSFTDDFDPDVKTAIIQTYTDHYLLNNLNLNELKPVFLKGIQEKDYIIKLVTLQSIKKLSETENLILSNFKSIIDLGLNDESQIIKDEAQKLFKG
jgi:hypothetical protein